MKKYGLRKLHKDGIHHGFQWPLEVGSIVRAPDWDPVQECGNGLHFLPEAQGNYGLLDGYYWAVVEYESGTEVHIDSDKAKVETCKIVHISESPGGLLHYFKDITFGPRSAYRWAHDIGDRDHMRQFVTDSRWAYHWARRIGDRDHMRQFVTDSMWAYHWARRIGDRDHMRQFVTDPK